MYNIPIDNVKKLVPNFFDKDKYVLHYEDLQLYLIKTTKNTSHIIIQSVTMVKTIYWIQHTKKKRSRKNNDKDEKALYTLMNNAIHGKRMEKLRNIVNVKLVNN